MANFFPPDRLLQHQPDLPPRRRPRKRIYTAEITFWAFLSQIFSADGTCAEAVKKVLAYLSATGREACYNTAAYCQARTRLAEQKLRQWVGSSGEHFEREAATTWRGHRVRIVDGSSVTLLDTPANQEEYPQPSSQKRGCGFPVMRIVVLFSLAAGTVLQIAAGSLGCSEMSLLAALLGSLAPGDILLGDRAYGGYPLAAFLHARGVHLVARVPASRKIDWRAGKRLGRRDRIVTWTRGYHVPKWMSPIQCHLLPEQVQVRLMHLEIRSRGFRTTHVRVVTTLLDPVQYPKEAFAGLYLQRWLAELYLRDLKTTMRMETLNVRSPAMARRNLYMYMIGYNLIRGLMVRAGRAHGLDPLRISFKGTLDVVRTWAPWLLCSFDNPSTLARLRREMEHLIAQCTVPDRPGRREPRAQKRRPKPYPFLTEPRHQFQEVPHRGNRGDRKTW